MTPQEIDARLALTLNDRHLSRNEREALREIIDEADRTARLIEDLLLLARADAGLPGLPLDRVELISALEDEIGHPFADFGPGHRGHLVRHRLQVLNIHRRDDAEPRHGPLSQHGQQQ